MRNALSRGFDLSQRTRFLLLLFMLSEKLNVTREDKRDIQPKNRR